MQLVIDYIKDYEFLIIIGLGVLLLILLFVTFLNKIQINRLEKKYKKMMKGAPGKSIEDLLLENNEKVEDALSIAKDIQNVYNDVVNRLQKSIQKVSIVRYRAFDDVGSDLSFSIAFLDQLNNGIILTGIYGRNECTSFAKPIENGISKYDLSEEEKQALRDAMSK